LKIEKTKNEHAARSLTCEKKREIPDLELSGKRAISGEYLG